MKLFSIALLLLAAHAQTPPQNREFEALQAHFERVIARRHDRLFAGVSTAGQWQQRRQITRDRLEKMLWHGLRPPAPPPPATVTHRQEHKDYTLENLVIETAPGFFLTANLYLPRSGARPFPVVLYQCGHASKTYYARHGAWFAAHGIAALVMDNIEMGEVEFTHHGVYSHAWFHWYSRGFSPLAVELWNARRAVDYLAARPELDRNRIGATGRSGGGITTFFLAALDERIRASAPVSGTISTNGWIRRRLTSNHCDCQYPVNSYGLTYSEIGALIAPRPQLHCNADADPGFPMDAFEELIAKIREIYRLYGAESSLRTAVAPGGHRDIEAIRLPVYSFFLREFLGKDSPLAAEGPIDEPPAEELVCYRAGLPLEERLTRADETFLPARTRSMEKSALLAVLREEVFRYFPAEPAPLDARWSKPAVAQGRKIQKVTFTSFEGLRVNAVYSLPAGLRAGAKLQAVVLVDHRRGIPVWGNEQPLERVQWADRAVLLVETLDTGSRALERNLRSFADDDPVHHMRRHAMVAGTTLESMQVYEILRALELLRSLPDVDARRITIAGKASAGVNGMYAALLDGATERVLIESPPASHRYGPHYLGILRYTDIRETAALLGGRIRIFGDVPPPLSASCASLADCLR